MYKNRTQLQTEIVSVSKANPQSPKNSPVHSQNLDNKRKSSVCSKSQNLDKLWRQSSLSLTRDRSPSYKIPNSIRFKSLKDYERQSRQFLTLQLRQNITSDKTVNFGKSVRPNHWVKGLGEFGPSPASYKCERFLQDSHYKSIQIKEAYKTNPFSAIYQEQKMRRSIKGQSFKKFQNHHKTYLQHTKHRFYQPQNNQSQPGPGNYNHSWANKRKAKNYTIRATLKKFNDTSKYFIPYNSSNPGPGAYNQDKIGQQISLNVKGTIPRSQRDFLTKFEDFPSPNQYVIHGFLQQYA